MRDGRYSVRGVLGEGAQGQTLEALDARSGAYVAIKRFDVRGARAWKDVELAEREARVLASLAHPLLPAYIEHFEEDGSLFLVMQKIEGQSLAARRKSGRAFSEKEAVRLLSDASSVFSYLHGMNPPIVHRDVKPSNVIQRPDGSFAFVDFGAVRDRMKPDGGSTVVGTFGYMAPEQFQGRALPASDIYALGATILGLLTAREPEGLPHRGLGIDVAAALKGHEVSGSLVRALSAMLEPDPDRRAERLAPLLETLGGASAGVKSAENENAPRASVAPPRRSHKGRSSGARAAIVLVWVGYAFGWTAIWPLFGHSWVFAVVWAMMAVVIARVAKRVSDALENELALMRAARGRGRSPKAQHGDSRIRVQPAAEPDGSAHPGSTPDDAAHEERGRTHDEGASRRR